VDGPQSWSGCGWRKEQRHTSAGNRTSSFVFRLIRYLQEPLETCISYLISNGCCDWVVIARSGGPSAGEMQEPCRVPLLRGGGCLFPRRETGGTSAVTRLPDCEHTSRSARLPRLVQYSVTSPPEEPVLIASMHFLIYHTHSPMRRAYSHQLEVHPNNIYIFGSCRTENTVCPCRK
jgi:hypothetical protein